MGEILMEIRNILKENNEEENCQTGWQIAIKNQHSPVIPDDGWPTLVLNTTDIIQMKSNMHATHSTLSTGAIKRKSSATPPGARDRKQPTLQDYFPKVMHNAKPTQDPEISLNSSTISTISHSPEKLADLNHDRNTTNTSTY